jgi:hypothetical protein
MAHSHTDHEKKPLAFFASPLVGQEEDNIELGLFQLPRRSSTSGPQSAKDEPSRAELGHVSTDSSDKVDPTSLFHRHAEASKAELFFDLCKSNTRFTSTSLTTLSQSLWQI